MARKLFDLLKERATAGVRTIITGVVLDVMVDILTLVFFGRSPYIPVCRLSWVISGD